MQRRNSCQFSRGIRSCIWCSAGVQLQVHKPTVKLMQEHYAKSGKEVNEARLRMATLPEGAEVSPEGRTSFRKLLQYLFRPFCTVVI